MSLEQVTDEILNDAEQKASEIVEEAREEAERIEEEAEEEAGRIKKKAEEEAEEKKQSIRKKALSNARMKARQLKLREKQQQLDEVFQQFRQHLEDMNKTERKKFVRGCLDRAKFDVGVVKGSGDFKDVVSERKSVDFEETDIDGIVLESEDGERRMDFSFDRIVENYRENLRKQVSEALFE